MIVFLNFKLPEVLLTRHFCCFLKQSFAVQAEIEALKCLRCFDLPFDWTLHLRVRSSRSWRGWRIQSATWTRLRWIPLKAAVAKVSVDRKSTTGVRGSEAAVFASEDFLMGHPGELVWFCFIWKKFQLGKLIRTHAGILQEKKDSKLEKRWDDFEWSSKPVKSKSDRDSQPLAAPHNLIRNSFGAAKLKAVSAMWCHLEPLSFDARAARHFKNGFSLRTDVNRMQIAFALFGVFGCVWIKIHPYLTQGSCRILSSPCNILQRGFGKWIRSVWFAEKASSLTQYVDITFFYLCISCFLSHRPPLQIQSWCVDVQAFGPGQLKQLQWEAAPTERGIFVWETDRFVESMFDQFSACWTASCAAAQASGISSGQKYWNQTQVRRSNRGFPTQEIEWNVRVELWRKWIGDWWRYMRMDT